MVKISPIAAYLTENHAVTKRQGNVWHFFSKEGLYLGKQIKLEQNGANAYIREIYGADFKKLFYECKVLGQNCVYIKDNKSPVGISILPVYSYVLTCIADFINNKFKSTQIESKLRNKLDMIALDQNVGVGIYNINRPFLYSEKVLQDVTKPLKKSIRIKHTFN